ncbi:MAG: TerB family tellurite resistance protein [Pirellulaceae bacterium]|nr:TerB family tellurite resistance protein [Pirellulaceae bacterium]
MDPNSPQRWFNLEEQFFKSLDNQLLNQLREQSDRQQTAESIMQLTGITDQELAEKIAGLNVSAQTLAAFRLVPLVAVAWANDNIDSNEQYVIDQAAEKAGLDQAARQLLGHWVSQRPGSELLDTWCQYAHALAGSLNEAERRSLQRQIMDQAQAVAHASGGVLGFGSVSPGEKAVLNKVKQALNG